MPFYPPHRGRVSALSQLPGGGQEDGSGSADDGLASSVLSYFMLLLCGFLQAPSLSFCLPHGFPGCQSPMPLSRASCEWGSTPSLNREENGDGLRQLQLFLCDNPGCASEGPPGLESVGKHASILPECH